MYESILIGIPVALFVIQYIRMLRKQVAGLEHKNQSLEKSLEIAAEMEVAKGKAADAKKEEIKKASNLSVEQKRSEI